MNLSKYIELLQRTLKYEGDLEVVCSDVDDDMEIEFYKKEYVDSFTVVLPYLL